MDATVATCCVIDVLHTYLLRSQEELQGCVQHLLCTVYQLQEPMLISDKIWCSSVTGVPGCEVFERPSFKIFSQGVL